MMPETWLAAVRIFRAIMSAKSLMTTHLGKDGGYVLAALRILRAIISAKLLMLTRCNV